MRSAVRPAAGHAASNAPQAASAGELSPERDPRAAVAECAPAPASMHVVAGALLDGDGRVLIAQRPAGKHMAGGWEFPGGKLEPEEDPFEGLARELREELGIQVLQARRLIAYEHAYADRRVFLELWLVEEFRGEPQPLDAQALRWVRIEALDTVGLLEADRPMVKALREALEA